MKDKTSVLSFVSDKDYPFDYFIGNIVSKIKTGVNDLQVVNHYTNLKLDKWNYTCPYCGSMFDNEPIEKLKRERKSAYVLCKCGCLMRNENHNIVETLTIIDNYVEDNKIIGNVNDEIELYADDNIESNEVCVTSKHNEEVNKETIKEAVSAVRLKFAEITNDLQIHYSSSPTGVLDLTKLPIIEILHLRVILAHNLHTRKVKALIIIDEYLWFEYLYVNEFTTLDLAERHLNAKYTKYNTYLFNKQLTTYFKF